MDKQIEPRYNAMRAGAVVGGNADDSLNDRLPLSDHGRKNFLHGFPALFNTCHM